MQLLLPSSATDEDRRSVVHCHSQSVTTSPHLRRRTTRASPDDSIGLRDVIDGVTDDVPWFKVPDGSSGAADSDGGGGEAVNDLTTRLETVL